MHGNSSNAKTEPARTREVAFFPLTPLGDAIAQMGQLEELHRLYAPCRVTVFAIPLIAELYRNYRFCDEAVELEGGIHGPVKFREVPRRHFDVVFSHGYEASWTEMLRQLDYGEAYGMEETGRPPEVCNEIFAKWVSLEYWRSRTLKEWKYVSEQMAEVMRLVNPDYANGIPRLDESNYRCVRPEGLPEGRYALYLPGTSALMKYWPIRKYFQLARLLESQGVAAVFVTGPQDTRLADELRASGFRHFDALSLGELAYCCAHAAVVVGNDSGPMHLAACLDAPSVHLFSFTGAHNWFQYNRDRHKLVMAECGRRQGDRCGGCLRTCIGKITLRQAYAACRELLGLPEARFRQVGYLAQDLIGDALVCLNELEALSEFHQPCEVTVFCTRGNRGLFDGHAFCDRVVCYEPGKWKPEELPAADFEAVFNTRYDRDSVELLRALRPRHAYGYENVEIPEALCRAVYDKWLPLSMWDDEELRYNNSVTEQGASLIRLVRPEYHCQSVRLAENTFVHDGNAWQFLERRTVLLLPAASSRYKHWGTANYLALAKALRERGCKPLFLLGPREMDYADGIRAAGFRVLSGLSFAQVAALMDAASDWKK